MVMNTFQFDAPSGWATWWDGPMLGIVHNPDRMRQAPQSMELVSAGRIGLLTLAPFVTTNLMQSDPVLYARVATITMAFPFPPRVAPRAPRGRTRVAIPGAVHFSSRDYEQILDALPRVLDEVQPDSFDICIVGGGPDRPQLEQLVAARDAAKYIRFAGLNRHGYVAGNAFYGLVRGSDFVLPNPTPEDMMYRSARITATIPTTVGLGIPTILDRWTATVYGVPAVSYPVGGLADGLVEALTMSAKDRKALEADLAEHRVLELHRASAEMAFALRSLGIRV
jgi:glycosyltransferase involved in cell wall biosynthesis